jgi:sugar phosphate isomerase/epimerase
MNLSIVLSTHATRFSALAFQEDWSENARHMADLGYDAVELAIRDPKLLDCEGVARLVGKCNLFVSAIGTGQAYGEEGLSFTDPRAEIRQRAIARIRDHVDFAAPFGAVVIIGLIRGRTQAGVSRDQAMDWLREALRECAAYAAPKGVRLAIEAINRYETDLIPTAASGLALLDELGIDNLGLLLDTFHMNIEEPSICESIARTGKRLFHFHVADSNRWYPGAGHIDFPSILATLRQIGYAGYVSGEMMPLPDPMTAAREMIGYLGSIGIQD